MPGVDWIPEWMVSALAVATVFTIMFHLGVAVAPAEYRAAWRSPWLMVKGIFASLVAVPVVAIVVARAFDLPREAQIGMVLMAISPGAPLALVRALGAGAARPFSAALQVTVTTLAAISMPLTIAALDEVYAGQASVAPWELARQVLVGQFMPLALGMAARRSFGARLAALEPFIAKAAAWLLVALIALVIAKVWHPVTGAGLHVALAVSATTLCATALGHALGGPLATTRTGLAMACGARNVGLALLVAAVNHAPAPVLGAILSYVLVSALALTPYVAWRRRASAAAQNTNLP